jgi:hypothetical protein
MWIMGRISLFNKFLKKHKKSGAGNWGLNPALVKSPTTNTTLKQNLIRA